MAVSLRKSSASQSLKSDRNEHALKWIIKTVEELVNEFSSASGDDLKECLHLELSTVKVLDELAMSTMEHAKTEVMLLTSLHEALSRLIEYGDQVIGSSEVIDRLKAFRDEMQKLFTLSPVCKIDWKPSGEKKQLEKSTSNKQAKKQESEDETESSFAERTKTPTDEALRPGHDMERSERVTELDESALQRLHDGWKNGNGSSSSNDTDAIKTPDPKGDQADPEEKSERILLDEELEKSMPYKSRSTSTPSKPRAKSQDDAIRTTKPQPIMSSVGKPTAKLTFKIDEQSQPEPRSMIPVRHAGPPTRSVENVEQETDDDEVNNFIRKLLIGLSIVALPIVLLWATIFVFEWNRSSGAGVVHWQLICNLANVFCENYGIACTEFCSSGLQREKWKMQADQSK